ncbi:MAG: hypothetical protein ACJ768_18925 [Gaiellaceae bacterium]
MSSATTETYPLVTGSLMAVSKPVRRCVFTGFILSALGPATSCHFATPVEPFQLTNSVSDPSALRTTSVAGRPFGCASSSKRNAR